MTDRNSSAMTTSPELPENSQEKNQAKENLLAKELELRHSQSRNYDLLKRCEELEQQVSPSTS